jgi:hypothetical protein
MKRWQQALFASGVALCLLGALLMLDGNLLGERTTGIATVIGIVGIGLIGSFSSTAGLKAKKNNAACQGDARHE